MPSLKGELGHILRFCFLCVSWADSSLMVVSSSKQWGAAVLITNCNQLPLAAKQLPLKRTALEVEGKRPSMQFNRLPFERNASKPKQTLCCGRCHPQLKLGIGFPNLLRPIHLQQTPSSLRAESGRRGKEAKANHCCSFQSALQLAVSQRWACYDHAALNSMTAMHSKAWTAVVRPLLIITYT